MRFLSFKKSALKNAWIKEGNLELYVRKTHPKHKSIWGDYQLANMKANPQGTGSLTKFLEKYEYHYQLYIENIMDKRLVTFFEKRGYMATSFSNGSSGDGWTSMLGPKPPSRFSKLPRKTAKRKIKIKE